jgi:hypothetical protein
MRGGFSPEAIVQIQYPERSWERDFLFASLSREPTERLEPV